MLAPDSPTDGGIVDAAPPRQIYETRAGELRLRARAHVEYGIVVVTELPYGVDKGGKDGVILELTMRHRVSRHPGPLGGRDASRDRAGAGHQPLGLAQSARRRHEARGRAP